MDARGGVVRAYTIAQSAHADVDMEAGRLRGGGVRQRPLLCRLRWMTEPLRDESHCLQQLQRCMSSKLLLAVLTANV